MKTTTLQLGNSVNRSHVRLAILLITLACFALSPMARAVCQEGCDAGVNNTFLGHDALINNTTGFRNTAVGFDALLSNTAGILNTASGDSALASNTDGQANTATGQGALQSNTIGTDNTATGTAAIAGNTTGNGNTGIGWGALGGSQTGSFNTGTGASALFRNRTGSKNTATGFNALLGNTTGSGNIAFGANAGTNLTTGNDNIDIGNSGVAREASTIRIGTTGTHMNTYVAGISGIAVPTGVAVIVDADGHLGTTTSSARYKEAIKPMDKASEAILALQPVTFRYKDDLDPDGIPQFGLVAEEVEKVNRDLVARDKDGKPYSVRYEAVNAMLLNEFLKEHKAFVDEQRKVQEQGATIARLERQIETLTAGLQKVSAELELSKAAPQTVLNSH
jgi:Chaperone of endosialidase